MPSDVAFIIDNSRFVSGSTFVKIVPFLQSIIDRLPINVQRSKIAVLYYGKYVGVVKKLNETNTKHNVMKAIEKIKDDPSYPVDPQV